MKETLVYLKEKEIKKLLDNIAREINRDYKKATEPVLLVCLLKGSVFFFSDLIRRLKIPLLLDFISIESREGGFRLSKDIKLPVRDRHVLIVKEVLNAGRKLVFLKNRISLEAPRSVKIVTLIDKPSRRELNLQPDYFGVELDDRYIFGYGMDHEEKQRQLRDIHLFVQ